ncbi:TetR/AcrR family transcriptional regulator [Halomonas stenophila]|uniref:TetR/AcrR family transcriptional repressor of nem operon n=1 Tax=Halomonas stenophila TaxID=795312 RepID=A0A7W5EXN1_9GAMM|nr:TetR/AcrR family transcriptional regulator [Halomonas stenophila]MBB3232755.1 TetR/AcrR family transcriptional repressor of nem operon [Halomonas stenophila]
MTRGRPIAFSPDDALAAALQVFWASGYQAASTRQLLEAMQLSRSSLYQAFGSKEQLFLAALSRYRERLIERLDRRLEAAPTAGDFLETLFLETAREAATERAALGCLIFNSATELGRRDDVPAREARDGVAAITGVFRRAVERGQAEGSIAPGRDPDQLARYLTLGMAGLRTLIKSGTGPEEARQAAALVLEALE